MKYAEYQSVKGCYLHCPRCGADIIPIEKPGTPPHELGLYCPHCQGFIEWVGKPKNTNKRGKSSKFTLEDIGIFYCEICGRSQEWLKQLKEWLEIHHKIPLEEGGTDTPDNILIVCNRHHKMIHDIRDYEYHHLKSIMEALLNTSPDNDKGRTADAE